MATYYWIGSPPGDISVASNYRIGGFLGPASTVVPGVGDVVQCSGAWTSEAPSEGVSYADWQCSDYSEIYGGTFYGQLSGAILSDGIFYGEILSAETINSGLFYGVVNDVYDAYGGSFYGDYVNVGLFYYGTVGPNTTVNALAIFDAIIIDGATLIADWVEIQSGEIPPATTVIMAMGEASLWVSSPMSLWVLGRISLNSGLTFAYGPNSIWTAPASDVRAGVNNLGQTGTLTLSSPPSSIGIGI